MNEYQPLDRVESKVGDSSTAMMIKQLALMWVLHQVIDVDVQTGSMSSLAVESRSPSCRVWGLASF